MPRIARMLVKDEPSMYHKKIMKVGRFRYWTWYFTDSVIIGSKGFVSGIYQEFKGYFSSRHEKRPKAVRGLKGVYSLKRLYGEG